MRVVFFFFFNKKISHSKTTQKPQVTLPSPLVIVKAILDWLPSLQVQPPSLEKKGLEAVPSLLLLFPPPPSLPFHVQ